MRQATFTCFKIDTKRIENLGESRNCSSRSGPPHGIGSMDKLSSRCLFWFPKVELRPRLLDCFGCCFIRNNTLDMIFFTFKIFIDPLRKNSAKLSFFGPKTPILAFFAFFLGKFSAIFRFPLRFFSQNDFPLWK